MLLNDADTETLVNLDRLVVQRSWGNATESSSDESELFLFLFVKGGAVFGIQHWWNIHKGTDKLPQG